VRGSIDEGKFSLFYFRDDRLVAVDSINRPQDHMLARKLLSTGTLLSVDDINDPGFDLKAFANRDVGVAHGAAS